MQSIFHKWNMTRSIKRYECYNWSWMNAKNHDHMNNLLEVYGMCSLWNHLVNRGCSMNDWWLWVMFIRIKFSYLYESVDQNQYIEKCWVLLCYCFTITRLSWYYYYGCIYGYLTTFSVTSLYYVSLSEQRRIFNIWSIDFQLSRILSLSINQSYHLNNFYLIIALLFHARIES